MPTILDAMRAVALALGVALLTVPHAAAGDLAVKLLYVQGKRALIVYVGHPLRQPILLGKTGPPHWSGDGRLISIGGYVVGRTRLPAADLTWLPTGEQAAYVTTGGGVSTWTPGGGSRRVVPDGWGAQSVAWSSGGALALGRAVCHGACGTPSHKEIWVWQGGSLRRIVGPLAGNRTPLPFAWHQIGAVPCDRFKHPGPAKRVIVGQRLEHIAAGGLLRDELRR